MGQGSGAEDLETRTLDLGSGLLGGFGKDGLYSLMGHPLNAGLGSRVRLRGDGWGKMVRSKFI